MNSHQDSILVKCLCVQVSAEAKALGSPGSGVTDVWELPDVSDGNWTHALCKEQQVLFTFEPSLH